MVVKTDAGTKAVADYLVGGFIDTIAVGTGTTAETVGDTQLVNEVFRQSASSPIVNFIEDPDAPDEYIVSIEITGGDEVPADTALTELGLFISSQSTMYSRDTFNAKVTDAGITTALRTRLTPPGG